MPQLQAIALEAPLVASPNQTMKALLVSRATLYTLLNAGELESIPKAERGASASSRSLRT
jgi:hypothetical protein